MREEYDFSNGKRGVLLGKVVKKQSSDPPGENVGERTLAVCIETPNLNFLIPRKIYDVTFLANNLVEVIDEEGKVEIYPARYFLALSLSAEIESILARIAV